MGYVHHMPADTDPAGMSVAHTTATVARTSRPMDRRLGANRSADRPRGRHAAAAGGSV